jgi:hypothetical protein
LSLASSVVPYGPWLDETSQSHLISLHLFDWCPMQCGKAEKGLETHNQRHHRKLQPSAGGHDSVRTFQRGTISLGEEVGEKRPGVSARCWEGMSDMGLGFRAPK